MFGKVIVFGLFEMLQKKKKKKSEDCVLESGFDLRVGSYTVVRTVTVSKYNLNLIHKEIKLLTLSSQWCP